MADHLLLREIESQSLMGTLTCRLDKVSPIPDRRANTEKLYSFVRILAGRRDLFGI